jgi:antitoxin component YwqK of YwqJK toxin-antitoxin module
VREDKKLNGRYLIAFKNGWINEENYNDGKLHGECKYWNNNG